MSKTKNLNLAAIKKEDSKQFNGLREVNVKGYTLTVDKVFRTTKITAMLREMVEKVTELRVKGADVTQLDFTTYGMLLTIKHFSSVDVPNKLEEQLRVLEMMIDNGFLLPIIESFAIEEMDKVREAVARMSSNIEELLAKAKDMKLENADILAAIDGNGETETEE